MKKIILLYLLLLSSLVCAQISTQSPPQTYVQAIQTPYVMNVIGSGTQYYQITWTVGGSLSACTVEVDSSTTGTGGWGSADIIAAQTCTSGGSFTSTQKAGKNFVRINTNASIIGTGSLTVTLTGYLNNPAGGGGGCITIVSTLSSACGTTAGTIASVTDGSTGSDCTVGGGTNKNACIYTGSAWAFAGSAASSPTFAQVTAGTNVTPLVIGTSGSLTVSGTGTINATNINGTSMAGLGTGIYKNTTGTGVPSIAVAGDFPTLNQSTTGTSGGLSGTPSITVNGITATTYNGGAFSGTFTGTPTFSGNIVFTGTPTFSNTLALNTSGTSGGLTGSPAITVSSCSGCGGGGGAWSALSNPTGNLSLTMGTNTSIFNTTTAVTGLFQFNNTTAAIISASQTSPSIQLNGTEFHAAASAVGGVSLQFVPGTGTDAASTFNVTHVGSATGSMTLQNSGPVAAGSDGVHPSYFTMIGNTTQPSVPANTVGFMGPTSATFTAYSLQFPVTSPSGGQVLQFGTPSSGIAAGTWVNPGSAAFPITVSGTVTSGGIPCFNSTTNEQTSVALTTNTLILGGGAGACPTNSLWTDNTTTTTYTGTGGAKAPTFISTGTTAGFIDYPQGTTSTAVAPCNVATSICEQAPTAVTSYLVNKPGVAASGTLIGTNASSVITQGFSGDANHSATVSWTTATSVGSTSLCSTTFCPAGTYRISAYIDVTTACTTTGSYVVNIIWTDDTTVSKTSVIPLVGLGVTPTFGPTAITATLVPTSTTDFGTGSFILRSTGATSINYSTTAGACATGGPGVGKLYFVVEPIS